MKIKSILKNFLFNRRQKKSDFPTLFLSPLKDRIIFKKNDKNNIPDELSAKEWNKILDKIWYAFLSLDRGSFLKSPRKRRMMEDNINEGLECFKKYYKHLK